MWITLWVGLGESGRFARTPDDPKVKLEKHLVHNRIHLFERNALRQNVLEQ